MSKFTKRIPFSKRNVFHTFKFGNLSLPVYILLAFVTTASSDTTDIVLQNKCDEKLYSKPYIIIREHRNGADLETLDTQGIIDLRNKIRRYVCINGAVIIYHEVINEEDLPDQIGDVKHTKFKIPHGESIYFSNGTLKIFTHKCMTINWVPKHIILKREFAGVPVIVDSTIPSVGMKATAMFLIANIEPFADTNPPVKILLNQIGFNHEVGISEKHVNDASFIVIGKGPYCLALPDSSKIVLITNAVGNNDVCTWTLGQTDKPSKDYKNLLRKGYHLSNYTWEECPPDVMKSIDNSTHNGAGPFAMLNPSKFTPHGSRRGGKTSGGDDFPGLDDANVNATSPCSEKPSDPACNENGEFPVSAEDDDNNDNHETAAEPKNLFITMETCETLPKYDADAMKGECEYLKDPKFSFDKLGISLELDYANSNDTSQPSPPLSLKNHPKLVWKYEVLILIASIFSKICTPIRMQSVFQLARIIDNYIAKAHTDEPETSQYSKLVSKSNTWEILSSRLQKCDESKATKPMEWTWPIAPDKNDTIRTYQAKSNPNLTMNEIPPSIHLTNHTRKKRAIRAESEFQDLIQHDLSDLEGNNKIMIQRSPPVFKYDPQDEESEFIYGEIPRWKRHTLINITLPFVQEYVPPSTPKDSNKMSHEDFILHPNPKHLRIKNFPSKQIFYYEDLAELDSSLNFAIDSWWKVWLTVLGHCQQNEKSREQSVYYLLFENFYQYFLSLIKVNWLNPTDAAELEMVLGEFLDDDRSQWLDTCLETSYIITNSLSFRPQRPLEVEQHDKPKFENGTARMETNVFVEVAEDFYNIDGSLTNMYFTRQKIG